MHTVERDSESGEFFVFLNDNDGDLFEVAGPFKTNEEAQNTAVIINKMKAEEFEIEDAISPSHYRGNIECIDAMVAAFGLQAVQSYARLNAFKYQWRADKKHESPDEDLKKAVFYLRYSMGDDPRKGGV